VTAAALARDEFLQHGYALLPGLLPDRTRSFLHEYAIKSAAAGKLKPGDANMPDTPCSYGDPFMEALLDVLIPTVEAASGMQLHPTYSYYRVYKRGDRLAPHRDRPSCETSLSITLGYQADQPWPLWIEDSDGAHPVILRGGDGVLYKGIERSHWRDPFDGEHLVQVFLHYVDRRGPYSEWMFDRRKALAGTPIAAQILGRLQAGR
jgi:hypothetical protein